MSALPKKIAVLMGGPGSERDVSLATGRGVVKALRSLGSEVTEIDVKGTDFDLPADTELAFLTIHGTFGEDGELQQILEDRGVPYTGESVAGSALAFDKIRSKEAFRQHDVTTPYWQIITVGQRPTIPIPDRTRLSNRLRSRRRLSRRRTLSGASFRAANRLGRFQQVCRQHRRLETSRSGNSLSLHKKESARLVHSECFGMLCFSR